MKILSILTFSILWVLMIGCRGDDVVTNVDDVGPCDECTLEPNVGPCDVLFHRYYFDQRTKKCSVFVWGGCDGVVPFDTLEECEQCGCD